MQLGDVVRLLSGGPGMTVLSVSDNGYATCAWFDADGRVNQHNFPVATLETRPARPAYDETELEPVAIEPAPAPDAPAEGAEASAAAAADQGAKPKA